MTILRYTASADTTITNAFEANLRLRGTGSNMGYADSLEIFSIYGQESGSNGQSQELSRALVKFPITTISADRTAGTIPASGSVTFHLKMYNAKHPFTLPQGFTLVVEPVSASWTEGTGLDMDEYKDLGQANWGMRTAAAAWTRAGADYYTSSTLINDVQFTLGFEDLETNVSHLVEEWIKYLSVGAADGVIKNYGFGVHLTASQEAYFSSSAGAGLLPGNPAADSGSVLQNPGGASQSYYTKKFFSRSTEFFFKRPVIEARWNSSTQDNRENFYYSSSAAPAGDNLNKLQLYNYVKGGLVNLPNVGVNDLRVSFYSSSAGLPTGAKLKLPVGGGVVTADDLNATASYSSAGIYVVQLALTAASTAVPAIHDVWHSGGVEFYTGSFYPELMPTYDSAPTFNRITSCTNLKKKYSTTDKSRFSFFVRDRDWSPTLYTVSTTNNPTDIIESASYAIYRTTDNYAAVPYGTGSSLSTLMSYDKKGSYFDLDVSLLEPDYMYEIRLSYYNGSIGDWQEQPQTFKFRVEE